MGRATRWLRSLLGGRRDTKEPKDDSGTVTAANGGDKRDKKRWSFENTGKDHVAAARAPVPAPVDHGWLRSLYSETEKEQSKHAIAVAAATAAAADAAVAAAQAAVAVVRLTSQGRGTMFSGGREKWAAVKIQTIFRAYLAKKALRALKALVKLQALVRGYLVRKQAAATLHSMQALIRAQATVRMQRSRNLPVRDPTRFHLEVRPRRSLERFDESRSDYAASFHSRRLSASMDHALNGCDESPKIVEMDPGRPKSRSRRPGTPLSECADDAPPHSSPLPCQVPARISIPDHPRRNFHDFDWCLTGEECRFSTAQSTPRFMNSGGIAPSTPAKSVCGGDVMLRRYHHHSLSKDPNYMAKTQSFEAKVRSQSAPKQRPEPAAGPKRLSSPHDVVEPRASLSGVRMHRSYSQAQETFSFKNAVVGRLDRSMELSRDIERDYYLQRRW